jgi:hypothetical protein
MKETYSNFDIQGSTWRLLKTRELILKLSLEDFISMKVFSLSSKEFQWISKEDLISTKHIFRSQFEFLEHSLVILTLTCLVKSPFCKEELDRKYY